jgi:hypothetical protein
VIIARSISFSATQQRDVFDLNGEQIPIALTHALDWRRAVLSAPKIMLRYPSSD